MTKEMSHNPQPSPMPRDYNPGDDDATFVRAIDGHNSEGQTHDERTNKHPLD